MFASLPWYDLSDARRWTDAWWTILRTHLRAHGFEVDDELERDRVYTLQWASDDLLLSQACGYDVRLAYADHLQLVATPCYSAVGCSGPNYSSFVVVGEDSPWQRLSEMRNKRCVVNTRTSHSGMNILRAMVAPLHREGRFFASVGVSGSHRQSLRAIARGEADVAAIDCVTYALLRQHARAELAGTRILCRTAERPAPPYVTRFAASPDEVARLRAALVAAVADPASVAPRDEILLDCFVDVPLSAYDAIAEMQTLAEVHGYFEIHPDID